MKNLLESGVHFGHQVKRWDPRMKKYIFTARNGIHIIDLQKTIQAIKDAYEAIQKIVSSGKTVLFVGTKKQAQSAIQKEAERCEQFYVNQRWLGGMERARAVFPTEGRAPMMMSSEFWKPLVIESSSSRPEGTPV